MNLNPVWIDRFRQAFRFTTHLLCAHASIQDCL